MTRETIANEGRIGNRVLRGGGQGKMSEVIEEILNLGFEENKYNGCLYKNMASDISNSFPYQGIRRNTLR